MIKIILSLAMLVASSIATSQNLQSQLDSIWKTDQDIRFELIKLQQEGKMNSDEMKDLIQQMKKQDSINLDQVENILQNGWPDDLNMQGNQTIFLVIQHADLQTQKKYLPVIEKAVQDNKTFPANLALLKDRMALREGKKQIYGSQIFIDSNTGKKYVQPLQNPEEVDKLRAEVGLPSMETYLQQSFQMSWNLEEYYENLPEIEKLLEERKSAK
jgi:polyhydroxyalkanoate synthesis regulator phasin